jgi:hypothetical protein
MVQCTSDKLIPLNILITSFIEGAAQHLEIFTAYVASPCAGSATILLS